MTAIAIDTTAAEAQLDGIASSAAARAGDVVAQNGAALLAAVQARLPAKLADSMQLTVNASDTGATATITSDAPYARLREYGGRIAVPEIVPVAAKVLAFAFKGKLIFARHTKPHEIDMQAHPSLAPALEDIAPQFRADLEGVLSDIAS
jgi:hypothetical protein